MRAAFSSKPRAEKGSAKPRALYHLTNVPRALSRSRRVSFVLLENSCEPALFRSRR
jgi:hypothetical protein